MSTYTVRRTERGNYLVFFDGNYVGDVYAMHVGKCRENVPEFALWSDEEIAEAVARITEVSSIRAPNLLSGGWDYFDDLGRQMGVRAREIVAEIADRRLSQVEAAA